MGEVSALSIDYDCDYEHEQEERASSLIRRP